MRTPEDASDVTVAGYEISLFSLVGFAVLGATFTVVFAHHAGVKQGGLATLGLMTAGAAAVVGGLVGFLFGVPHVKELAVADPTIGAVVPPSNGYKPNTSLEQISDWLSKIIVGVGLVEVKQLLPAVRSAAAYLASGYKGANGVEAFFVSILIYFAVCGFIFGFLWARIYLRKWFAEADTAQVERLGNKVDELEARYVNDAKALHMLTQQLQRSSNDPKMPEIEVNALVKGASTSVKVQLFDMAKRASESTDTHDYHLRNETSATIFRALIASDEQNQFFRNHAELSYALSRRQPPDFVNALESITDAITVRDRCGVRGYKYYEMRRALCRIKMDESFKTRTKSEVNVSDAILADLRVAATDKSSWSKWYKDYPDLSLWLDVNQIPLPLQ